MIKYLLSASLLLTAPAIPAMAQCSPPGSARQVDRPARMTATVVVPGIGTLTPGTEIYVIGAICNDGQRPEHPNFESYLVRWRGLLFELPGGSFQIRN